jgi:hypothetical protein
VAVSQRFGRHSGSVLTFLQELMPEQKVPRSTGSQAGHLGKGANRRQRRTLVGAHAFTSFRSFDVVTRRLIGWVTFLMVRLIVEGVKKISRMAGAADRRHEKQEMKCDCYLRAPRWVLRIANFSWNFLELQTSILILPKPIYTRSMLLQAVS